MLVINRWQHRAASLVLYYVHQVTLSYRKYCLPVCYMFSWINTCPSNCSTELAIHLNLIKQYQYVAILSCWCLILYINIVWKHIVQIFCSYWFILERGKNSKWRTMEGGPKNIVKNPRNTYKSFSGLRPRGVASQKKRNSSFHFEIVPREREKKFLNCEQRWTHIHIWTQRIIL